MIVERFFSYSHTSVQLLHISTWSKGLISNQVILWGASSLAKPLLDGEVSQPFEIKA